MTVQLVWRWAGNNWEELVLNWIKTRVDWRQLSGVEMTWLLYELWVANIPDGRKREVFTATQDWEALRAYDTGVFNESDL